MESDIPDYISETYSRACPREGCGSSDVKFRYFNNRVDPKVGYTQPRYNCNACWKLFTRGGTQYKKSQNHSKPEAIVRTTKPAATGNRRMNESPRAAATTRRAASLNTARRRPSRRRRQLVLSSSSSETNSEEDDEVMGDEETSVEASTAEEDQARVRAEEFEEEPVDSESNSEEEAGGEPDEETIPPEETDIAPAEETPAPSMCSRGRANLNSGPCQGLAKVLVVEKIKKHLLDAGLVLSEIQVENEALKADLTHRGNEILSTLINREFSAAEEEEKSKRDEFVAAIRSIKAENGRVYEYSLEKCNQLREREDDVTDAGKAIDTLRFQVENTDIDHASHSDLVKIEKKALRLRYRVYRLNEC